MTFRSYLLSTASEAVLGFDRAHWTNRIAFHIINALTFTIHMANARGLAKRSEPIIPLTAAPTANDPGDEPSSPERKGPL